jgi:Baseplate J-like protein
MVGGGDRRAALRAANFNGIDFVEVDAAQTTLRVHFINDVPVGPLTAPPRISGGETIPNVAVSPSSAPGGPWGWDDGHVVLTLTVPAPGDFSNYVLTLTGGGIDPFLATATFSFKAGCPTGVDCAAPAPVAPAPPGVAPRINYLAKDFLSFRQALIDFSAANYPDWQERSEADFGMMFLEALSALGDDLSYAQDRVAREASLVTATQRRSVTRHARLVDYEPGRTLCATALLQFDAAPGAPVKFPKAVPVIAPGADGTRVVFETGLGLNDGSDPPPLNPGWNRDKRIAAYWPDDGALCLPVGATAMMVAGQDYGFQPGQSLLIETLDTNGLNPPIRQVVRLLGVGDPAGPWATPMNDPVFGVKFTRIAWTRADAIEVARDQSRTTVIGNIVVATQGQTLTETFQIGPSNSTAQGQPPLAIERAGPSATGSDDDRPVVRLHTLANAPVGWLAAAEGTVNPEISIVSNSTADDAWLWRQTLLESGESDRVFTLDPIAYRALPPNYDGTVAYEVDGDSGDTVRFGDGVFGANPEAGQLFSARYRVSAGAAGNVAADAINQIDQTSPNARFFTAVSNVFAASGGADAESLLSVRRMAPQKFRSVPMRAVLPADYVAAAETLPWVKRAGCASRWTGSWMTTFTTPEPAASEQILVNQRLELVSLLNRFRMAGAESYVPDPVYESIDLAIQLCAAPDSFAAQVKQSVVAALSPNGAQTSSAFFAVSRFGFGEPLYRAALEAAIQNVPGVGGVTGIQYRLRDHWLDYTEMGDVVQVGPSQILRCDNDPSRPAAGVLSVTVSGGR